MPSVECITSLTPPAPLATATKVPVESKPSAKHKPSQFEAAGDVREVQVMPSGEVIIAFVPMATNNASGSAQMTFFQAAVSSADARTVQVIPSGEVITRLVPPSATATNNRSSGD